MPTPAVLFATLLFSVIGMAGFVYGRKTAGWRALTISVALMVYPYFVEQTWLLYAVGAALTVALIVLRD